jgi:hypothetical protein
MRAVKIEFSFKRQMNNKDKLIDFEDEKQYKTGLFIAKKEYIFYKQVRAISLLPNISTAIIELTIPVGTLIVKPRQSNGKLRVNQAIVKGIFPDIKDVRYISYHDVTYNYFPGKVCKPEEILDKDINKLCASGIHCFVSYEEAKDYDFNAVLFMAI